MTIEILPDPRPMHSAMVEMISLLLASMSEKDRAVMHALLEFSHEYQSRDERYDAATVRAFAHLKEHIAKKSEWYARYAAKARTALEDKARSEMRAAGPQLRLVPDEPDDDGPHAP